MLEKITELINAKLHIAPNVVITEETDFISDLRADSFELMEIIVLMEDEYGIKIEDYELENIRTVGDVMDFIRSQGIDED